MLFKRRRQETRRKQLRLWLWPRVSWRRSAAYYLKRILRLSGTPYAIAMGVAVGVAISFTPLIGFHIALAALIAWLLRANVVAAALGTAVGNPLTFPIIWATTYEVGHFLLRGVNRDAPSSLASLMERPIDQIMPFIKPMLAGSIPLGLAVGAIIFAVAYKGVAAYQEAKRRRLREPKMAAAEARSS